MLKQGLEELGFSAEIIERVLPKLNSYINELELFNSAYDLVGADTHQDIVVRHILDSLAPYSHLQNLISQARQNSTEQIEIADVGTGGGLPGIPLAIVFDDVHFTLVERMSKRCVFLENCRAVLQLENVTVKTLEAERVPQNSFDIVVFRAFRPLEKKMIRVLLRILKPNGKLAAYKAKMEKIQAEKPNAFCTKRNPDYMEKRRYYEEILRQEFLKKGGIIQREVPHYMVVEKCDFLESWYENSKFLKIPIEQFDKRTISFTYGDSHPTFSDKVNDGKEYRKKLYTYDEILEIIKKYGLPQSWNPDGKFGPERYVEVHIWSDETISEYLS